MKRKPLVLIVTISLGVLLLVLFSYYIFIKERPAGDQEGDGGGFFSFLPFGGGGNNEPGTGGGEYPPEDNLPPIENYDQKLRLISKEPVSGMIVLERERGEVVRYIEKSTGHIYDVELFSPNKTRVSNTTIPVVYDSLWNDTGTSMLASYLQEDDRTVDIYGIIIKPNSTSTESVVSAVKFPPNIKDFSVFKNSLFYQQETDIGSVGYISNFDGTGKKQVLSSPIKEFSSQYIGAGMVGLTTKPHQGVLGYMYFLNTNTGSQRVVLRKIYGLTTLVSPDANMVLYSENANQSVMYLYNIKNNLTQSVTPASFPEKCVFSKKNIDVFYCATPSGYIDGSTLSAWYKGLVSTEDIVWKHSVKQESLSVSYNLYSESGYSIDVIKPQLSPNERYLVFINKTDGSLWSLDLSK